MTWARIDPSCSYISWPPWKWISGRSPLWTQHPLALSIGWIILALQAPGRRLGHPCRRRFAARTAAAVRVLFGDGGRGHGGLASAVPARERTVDSLGFVACGDGADGGGRFPPHARNPPDPALAVARLAATTAIGRWHRCAVKGCASCAAAARRPSKSEKDSLSVRPSAETDIQVPVGATEHEFTDS